MKIPKVKFLNIGPLFVDIMQLATGIIGEGKEILYLSGYAPASKKFSEQSKQFDIL